MKTYSKKLSMLFLLLVTMLAGCNDEDGVTSPNQLVAIAGEDKTIAVQDEVLLDGSGSYGRTNVPVTYSWSIKTKPQGSQAALVSGDSVKATFTPDVSGLYRIQLLILQDNLSAMDEVVMNVTSDEPEGPSEFATLFPDDIYIHNSGDANGVRLDPLLNDSLYAEVTIAYTAPDAGTIHFIENEGWFYKPDPDFLGLDHFTYTVCHQDDCLSASITMHVEEPLDPATCTWDLHGESVTTKKDQPIAIRIFDNDKVCPYQGSELRSPEKGRFASYAYSGSYKNVMYVYYPPKGFVGTDRFVYRLATPEGYAEVSCEVTITE